MKDRKQDLIFDLYTTFSGNVVESELCNLSTLCKS